MRDHWFATTLLTIVDVVKVVFSFIRADDTINTCTSSSDVPEEKLDECKTKVQLSQTLGIIVAAAQALILVSIVDWCYTSATLFIFISIDNLYT
jgi:hypothetical protein